LRCPKRLCPAPCGLSALQERDLEDVFYKYGKLTNIWIARNPPGFAYVVSRRPPSLRRSSSAAPRPS
jgi:hypothetical protein